MDAVRIIYKFLLADQLFIELIQKNNTLFSEGLQGTIEYQREMSFLIKNLAKKILKII